MDFKAIAETLAKIGLPILGAALPLPGGAALGAALAGAIGHNAADATQSVIDTLTQSAEARQKAIEFAATHEEVILRITVDAERDRYVAEVADRASARTMQIGTLSITVPTLAFLIVGCFMAMVGGTLLGYAKVDSVLAGTLVGYLSAKCEQVVAFYFGSSAGSARKTELLSQAPSINGTPS